MTVPTRGIRRLRRVSACSACGGPSLGDYCGQCIEKQDAVTAPHVTAKHDAIDGVLQRVVSLVDSPQPWGDFAAKVWVKPTTAEEAERCAAACVKMAAGLVE